MVDPNKPMLVALHDKRERVIDALSIHFANDTLDMDEFEQRVDLAHRATSVADLDVLLADLKPTTDEQPSASPVPSLVPRTEARQVHTAVRGLSIASHGWRTKRVLAILSDIQRKGTWPVPKKLRVRAVLGSVGLDFREAQMGPGVTEVKVRSIGGEIKIIVPPHLRVECEGRAVLGSFEGMHQNTGEPNPDAPLLRITGRAIFGTVEISTRQPGET